MIALSEDANERFWEFVQRHPTECWTWSGVKMPRGYGRFNTRVKGRMALAHRVSYELTIGEIPRGQEVCHTCDNPNCVRPSHLFLGSHKENMWDSINKKRMVCKLSADAVVEIRSSVRTHSYMAAKYNVHPEVIRNIRLNKKWHDPAYVINRDHFPGKNGAAKKRWSEHYELGRS